MRRIFVALVLTILTTAANASVSFADEWRTITPDVVYGHKAGMALTYDVIKGAAHGFPGEQGTQAETALLAWFEKYLASPTQSK